jgi:hypothetical protein
MVNKAASKYHGEFYVDWKEYQDEENNLYWYNKKSDISTWENPLFIFITLVENKINKDWIPCNIESLEENYIKISFTNKRVLYMNKSNKVINFSLILNLYKFITFLDPYRYRSYF